MLIGVIGDDFTGSSDIANNLKKAGMSVSMYAGVPKKKSLKPSSQAIVIALKTRTIPVKDAIKESLKALDWLKNANCKKFIFKYCSTFDSTKKGNIGPVIDAIMENLKCDFTIACPSFPDAGRSLYFGHMFVNGIPLNECGMENHPLTPMTDHNLVRWLNYQTKNKVGLIDITTVKKGSGEIKKKIVSLKKQGMKYCLIDTIENIDFDQICEGTKHLKMLTGGSGIALGLPKIFKKQGLINKTNKILPKTNSYSIILSGSCSNTTLNQIRNYKNKYPSLNLSPDKIINDSEYFGKVIDWIIKNKKNKPLLYSSSKPDLVKKNQEKYGKNLIALKIEAFFQDVVSKLYKEDFKKIVSAGGETSGAVVKGLGIEELQIGQEIAAGVPIMWEPNKSIKIALKSGNFGQEDFFSRALKML